MLGINFYFYLIAHKTIVIKDFPFLIYKIVRFVYGSFYNIRKLPIINFEIRSIYLLY